MADELVPAIWRGPYPALLPNSGVLNPGDEALVTAGDLLSSHWEPVKPAVLPPAAPVNRKPDDERSTD